MRKPFLLYFVILLFSRCHQGHREGSFSTDFIHQPLNEFADSIIGNPTVTAVELLGYSGGDVDKRSDELHYCQFIGIDKATGDTIRILAAVIDFPEAGKPGFTPSTTYDFDKGVRDATFRVPNDNDKMVLSLMPGLQGGQPDINKLKPGSDGTAAKEYVMIPKDVPFFAKHFKTIKGILSFKQQPW